MEAIRVRKRSGQLEPLDFEKIHKVINWAQTGLNGVSVSEVELSSKIQFCDGMSTSDIHEVMIKSAADLISEKTPDYQYLSARMLAFHIRKKAYGQFEPPTIAEHLKLKTEKGIYDKSIIESYSAEELAYLDSVVHHDRDFILAYAGAKQYEGKYLVQDRVTGKLHESPQMGLILLSMTQFIGTKDKAVRLELVKGFYDAVSLFELSLPTPIMSGVRTPTRQFSSCVLIEADDSLDSINATSSSILKYVSQRAGIGVNIGRMRALGSSIRGGEAFHTGVIPFIKHFQTAVKSCSQGGVRGGAATIFYPIWHLEVESLLVLKNNRGIDENRARHLDYGVQINKLFYKRMIEGGMITLFSPSDVPGLYNAFSADQELFEKIYTEAEANPSIRKKQVKAIDLFTIIAQERAQTGRIYIQNIDNCNTHSAFNPAKAPVRQSNLCLEIALPTEPLNDINDEDGEIALCTLAGINLGLIDIYSEEGLQKLERNAYLIVMALDNLLDYQDYPILAARKSTMKRRPLGVGTTNLAYYLAKNGVRYSDGSANKLVHETFEALQFMLLKASVRLAKERGACPGFGDTSYAQGLLPIDTYSREVDEIAPFDYRMDWEGLRADIAEHGLRNSTLTALMPSETSSQIANATNGIEPPRALVSVKASKDGILRQVVPEIEKYGKQYETLWTIPNNKGYLGLVAIMQKFVDQAISANTNYDPARFNEDKVPIKLVLQDLLYAYKMGVKTLYYHNTRDGANDQQEDGCEGACIL